VGGFIHKNTGYHRIVDGGFGLQMCNLPHVFPSLCGGFQKSLELWVDE
jgi:hypothetical protein